MGCLESWGSQGTGWHSPHRPFPQSSQGGHTLASKFVSLPVASPSAIPSGRQQTRPHQPQRQPGPPPDPRPDHGWALREEVQRLSQRIYPNPRPSYLPRSRSPHPALLLPRRSAQGQNQVCRSPHSAEPRGRISTAPSRSLSDGRLNPFVFAAFLLPALADAILRTAPPRLCQGPDAGCPAGAGGALPLFCQRHRTLFANRYVHTCSEPPTTDTVTH